MKSQDDKITSIITNRVLDAKVSHVLIKSIKLYLKKERQVYSNFKNALVLFKLKPIEFWLETTQITSQF